MHKVSANFYFFQREKNYFLDISNLVLQEVSEKLATINHIDYKFI